MTSIDRARKKTDAVAGGLTVLTPDGDMRGSPAVYKGRPYCIGGLAI
jgi:hypothetical protein